MRKIPIEIRQLRSDTRSKMNKSTPFHAVHCSGLLSRSGVAFQPVSPVGSVEGGDRKLTFAELLKWRKGRKKYHNNKRKERLAEARLKGTHTDTQWWGLQFEFDYQCVQCGDATERLAKDHILPICLGGSDSIKNLQPLCLRCNSSKGTNSFNWVKFRRKNGFV